MAHSEITKAHKPKTVKIIQRSKEEWIYEHNHTFKIAGEKHIVPTRAGIIDTGSGYYCITYHRIGQDWHRNVVHTDDIPKCYDSRTNAKKQVVRYLKGMIQSNQLCHECKKLLLPGKTGTKVFKRKTMRKTVYE